MYRPRHVLLAGWMLWAVLNGPVALLYSDGVAEDETVAAMCQTGLTTSAIAYVTTRRGLVAADPSATAKWTMRLMECHAWAALQSHAQAAEHWLSCDQVLQEFASAVPDHKRLPWLQWQSARCNLLRAQADVALYLAAPANQQPRELALQRVREILQALEELETQVKRLQPLAAREGLAGGKLAPAEQLAQLVVDVGLLRCESLLLRTRMYPIGSADRIASATDVDRQATEILARTEPDWPSRPQLQVAQAAARLDLGQSAEALRMLEQLAAGADHRQARIRAATLAVEYLSSQAQSASAAPQLSRGAELLSLLERDEAGPELELASIQWALAETRNQSGATKDAALTELLAKSKRLGEVYGDYWRSRGESMLVRSGATPATSGDSGVAVDLLIAEVRQLLAADQTQDAIARLLSFRDNEAAAGRGGVAVRVASQASGLWQRQQAWVPAADAVAEVSRQFADAPGAPEAHLQAVFCISQALRGDPQNAAVRGRYEQLLLEQLRLWPDAPTSDKAQGWLGSWLTAAGRHAELADAYLQRALASAEATVAEASLLDWLAQTLKLSSAAAQTRQLSACAAAREAGELTIVAKQAQLAEVLAETFLTWQVAVKQAEQLRRLAELERDLTASPWSELAVAMRWLYALRAGQQYDSLAPQLIDWEPSRLPPPLREGLAPALIAAIDETPLREHMQWATGLKLDATWQTELLQSSSPHSQAAGYRIMAWRGEMSAALDGLKTLVEQAGRDGGAVQLELANALADSGSNRWEDSSRVAKILIANSPAGSELQWAARWRWAKNQILAGGQTEARQAARLLLATQPPAAEIWKQRFTKLAE